MNIITIDNCPKYTAEDHAVAREFISPNNTDLQNLSIAKIIVPPLVTVKKHYHKKCEEVYQVIEGDGLMFIDGEESPLKPGQAVPIKTGQWHTITNHNKTPLTMIATCSPPWSFEDQVFEI